MYIIYGVIAVVGSVAAAAGGIVCITLRIIESLDDEETQDTDYLSEEECET
jgi:hypothetical protein